MEIIRHDEVLAADPAQPDSILRLALLNPGDTFGERALLSDTDRRTGEHFAAFSHVLRVASLSLVLSLFK